jgi:hypothetical protein
MMAPTSAREKKDKGQLEPYFVNEVTTITLGAACDEDSVEGPIEATPNEDDFITSRTASEQKTKGGTLQCGYPLAAKGSLTYNKTTGMTEASIARSVGLEPQFGASSNGCQSWRYKVKSSYQTGLEFSAIRPPVHSAKFWYDGRSNHNFPKYLVAQVQTDFTKNKGFRYMIAQLGFRNTVMRAYIRHISISLEARLKRMDPEDYFRIPGPGREGAMLKATVVFDDVEAGGKKLKRVKRNTGEDTDLVPDVQFA